MHRKYYGLFILLTWLLQAQAPPAPKAIATGEAFRAPSWAAAGELGDSTPEGRLRLYPDTEVRELAPTLEAADGTRYLVFTVSSEGAAALRLHFTEFHLADNARLFVYSLPEDGSEATILGPYTSAGPLQMGEFWSPSVPGARAAIELQWTGDLDELPFRLGAIGHLDRMPEVLPALPEPEAGASGVALYRGRRVPYQVVGGVALSENCILLGRPEDLVEASSDAGQQRESTGIVGQSYRWPNGIVPYTIDPTMPAQDRITAAVDHWNRKLAGTIRLVPRTTETYYVTFVRGTGCSSYVGNISYPGQPINLADGCSTGNAIHEIGHSIGLWHEHTRNDRDTYITVQTANINSGAAYNFQKTGSSGQDLGAYDYGSIMHYSAYSFSANGYATIVTIPPGIPIGQRTALSAGDINGVLALYPASTPPPPPAPVSVTIASNPSGMVVTVDGTAATTPATYSWTPGTTHTVAAASQSKSGTTYNFSSWSDAGAASHTITTPAAAATYTVSFAAQPPPPPAPVTITVTSSPSGMSLTVDGVAVTAPASYSWTPGTTHTVAAANQSLSGTNYNFGSWSDGGAASHTVTVPSTATTYTASFAAQAQQPVTVTIASNPSGLSVTVDGSSVVAPATFSWIPGTTHTLGASNQTSGGKSYLFNAWSNGGAASQTITTPTAASTYTASFTQQLPTTVTVASSPAGLTVAVDGSNVVTPASFSWQPGTTHSLVAANQDSAGNRYLFSSWSCGSTSAQNITTPAAATTYTANFTQQQPSNVTFASVPAGLSVSVDGAAVTTPATFSWFPGTTHTIAASNQSSGGSTYNFTSWSDSGAATHAITTPASATAYTATFTLQPVSYTVTTNPAGLVVAVDGAAVTAPATFSWLPGSSHTLAAADQSGAATKYIFSSWSNGGTATQTIAAPASPATYSANFSRQYLLSAVAAPANGGSITASVPSSGGYYPANTSLSLTATPVSGYCFVNWSGSAASSNPVLQLNMAQPLSVTANFGAGSVSLSPGVLTVQATGGVLNVTVTASCPWALSAPPSWARYSQSTGTATATVALTVDPNPSTAARSFYLAAGSRRILVYQYGKK